MESHIREIIERNYKDGSSALILDIRDSSGRVRELSYDNPREKEYSENLKKYTNFMVDIYQEILKSIHNILPNDETTKYAFNDTGDGCLCVFWDDKHPLTCLTIACVLYKFIMSHEYSKKEQIRFGIGLHTGGSMIYRVQFKYLHKDFVFGIAANTTARVEKFSKRIKNANLLFTGNFKMYLEKYLNQKSWLIKISDSRFDLEDKKEEGHYLYTLNKEGIDYLTKKLKNDFV